MTSPGELGPARLPLWAMAPLPYARLWQSPGKCSVLCPKACQLPGTDPSSSAALAPCAGSCKWMCLCFHTTSQSDRRRSRTSMADCECLPWASLKGIHLDAEKQAKEVGNSMPILEHDIPAGLMWT